VWARLACSPCCGAAQRRGKIIVTDKSPHRLEMAQELGADMAINVAEQDRLPPCAPHGRPRRDVTSRPSVMATVQQALAITRTGGNVTWIGNSAQMIELNMQEIVTRELTVRGTYGFNTEFRAPSTPWPPAGSTWTR